MARRRLHRGWLAAAAVAIAAAPALWRWIDAAREPQAERLPGATSPFPGSQASAAGSHELAPPRTAAPLSAGDPVGSTTDLKRVFDDHIDSPDPRQRRAAVRAFEACMPAFMPAAGQSPSAEPLIAALPPDHRAEREAAYRSLLARCHRLLSEARVSLDDTLRALQRDPQNEAPGLRAQQAALAGSRERIEALVAEAAQSADPAAVASLAGLAARIAALREPGNAAALERAREVDAALPWVACDLGLDCGAQSLWALQLCAAEGLCEGDVPARLTARISSGSVDPLTVQQQRLRLLGLIRSGRTLGSADLLPP